MQKVKERIAQEHYNAFRKTVLDRNLDESERRRGPGYTDIKENIGNVSPRRYKLYGTDRDKGLMSTGTKPLDIFYETDRGLSFVLKEKGNPIPLKSATQRFPEIVHSVPGPGSYDTSSRLSISGNFIAEEIIEKNQLKKPETPHSLFDSIPAFSSTTHSLFAIKSLKSVKSPDPRCGIPRDKTINKFTKIPGYTFPKEKDKRKRSIKLIGVAVGSSTTPNYICKNGIEGIHTRNLEVTLTPKNAYNGAYYEMTKRKEFFTKKQK